MVVKLPIASWSLFLGVGWIYLIHLPYLISPLAGARICWLSSVDGAAFKLSGSRPLGAKKIAIYIRRQSVS